jgi:2-polyprenyl-3-methyl-5-hydroxy-6-metoxy-1,4-benzoquinol methylase
MKDYFAGRVAERYDETTAHLPVQPVVDFLADRAGGGAALELGIGTGRLALPLAARGVTVHGIDLSPDMVPSYAGSRVARRLRSRSATSRRPA